MLWRHIRLAAGAAATLFILITASACDQPRPIPPGTDRFYYGHLIEGEKFGVSVGMSRDEAVDILMARGMRDHGIRTCTSYIAELTGCYETDSIYFTSQRNFGRDGFVYMKIIDDRVDFISWSFVIKYIVF